MNAKDSLFEAESSFKLADCPFIAILEKEFDKVVIS